MAKGPIEDYHGRNRKKVEDALVLDLSETRRSVGAWLFEVACGYTAYEKHSGKLVTDGMNWESAIKFADAVCILGAQPYRWYHKERDYRNAFLARGRTPGDLWDLMHGRSLALIEAKRKASPEAVGQLITYAALLQQDFGCKVDRLIILAAESDYAVCEVAPQRGIELIIAKDVTPQGYCEHYFSIDGLVL